MCTASLIATGEASWRFAFNRDELRSRADALPPERRELGDVTAAWPIDGEAGGTWIGVNDRGLILALLNRNAGDADRWQGRTGLRSRGGLIPPLMSACSASLALAGLRSSGLEQRAPFTALIIHHTTVITAAWDGQALNVVRDRGDRPLLWASSGYGDARVAVPRTAAFAAVRADPSPATQDAFHASRDGDDQVAWVAMRRADARSVSRTVIEVAPDSVTMRYVPLDDDGAEGTATELRLERRA